LSKEKETLLETAVSSRKDPVMNEQDGDVVVPDCFMSVFLELYGVLVLSRQSRHFFLGDVRIHLNLTGETSLLEKIL
jgi:hypothetical protein